MTLVTTNLLEHENQTPKSAAAVVISLATYIGQIIKRDRHPHFYRNEHADRLERARQDVNRLWVYGR